MEAAANENSDVAPFRFGIGQPLYALSARFYCQLPIEISCLSVSDTGRMARESYRPQL